MGLMPVPSEGALRILRHLAFGTSCTAVFTLGLILEDRQRLIYTAQKLRSNSQKLKSSKRYTTAGASAIKALEDRILKNHENNSAEDVQKTGSSPIPKEQNKNLTPMAEEMAYESGLRNPISPGPLHLQSPLSLHNSRVKLNKNTRGNYKSLISGNMQGSRQISNITKLEKCISSLLGAKPPQIDRATTLFLHIFLDYVDHDQNILGLTEVRILSLALSLFRVCKNESKLDYSQKIFQLVLKWGIEKNIFISFQLENIVRKLLNHATPTSLEKAVFIYLSIITSRKTVTPELLYLGHELCEKTSKVRQFKYTREIFHQIKNFCDEFPRKSMGYILVSLSKDENYQAEVTEYFIKYSVQTKTKLVKEQYNNVVMEVVDHLLAHRKFSDAEKIITMALCVAEQQRIIISVIPCVRLLQNDWNTFRDLDRLIALFNRVINYIHSIRYPWVLYEMMIKICIEAEDPTYAWSFHKSAIEKYGQRTGILLAQFTLFKAKKGDWEGVINDFKVIDKKDVDEYSKLFPKILKEYSNNNSFSEIEAFLESAFKAGINLSIDAINKIAEGYARDRDFEALTSLIQYATRKGHALDSTFVNMILKQAYTHWRYKIEDILGILESMIKLNPTNKIVNINTFFLLRSIIVSKKRRSGVWRRDIFHRLEGIFQPYLLEQRDPHNPKQILWEMVVSLNANDPKETLAIYNWASTNNVKIGPEHLNVAVEASFRCSGGNTQDALKMIHSSGLSGPRTATSISLLFIHQLQHLVHHGEHTADEIVRLTLEFISAFEKRGLKVPVKVVTQTMSTLERSHYYLAVIDFWEFVSSRLSLTTSALEITTLTVFLKTFIGLKDIPGFWHVFSLLDKNKIIPDQHFSLILENAKRNVTRGITTGRLSNKKNIQFLDTLTQGRMLVTQVREAAFIQRNTSVPHLIEKMAENFKTLSPAR